MRRDRVVLKLLSKLLKNYCLLFLKWLAGDTETVNLLKRREITFLQKKQFEQVIWGKKQKDSTSDG